MDTTNATSMHRDGIQFHNVGELRNLDDRDGQLMQRVPESIRTRLEAAATRMCHPAGVELRFVPDGPVRVTLSSHRRDSVVRPFWGPFQATDDVVTVGPEPRTITLSRPENLDRLDPSAVAALDYDPRVCRLLLPGEHRGGHVHFHGVEGEIRPPEPSELPSKRYLAYGTSITEGEAAMGEPMTYVNQAATRLGVDPLNLGTCGTAYCDEAMAEHIAGEEWDVATLSLSVNMVGEFSVETFRERAAHMVETVAASHPDSPVVCITILPNARDLVVDHEEGAECERFREALRSVVAECEHPNVSLVEGRELLPDPSGLATDLVHPGDHAMVRIGENLARELERVLQ